MLDIFTSMATASEVPCSSTPVCEPQSRRGANSVAAYQDAIWKCLTQKSAAQEMGRCKKLPASGVIST